MRNLAFATIVVAVVAPNCIAGSKDGLSGIVQPVADVCPPGKPCPKFFGLPEDPDIKFVTGALGQKPLDPTEVYNLAKNAIFYVEAEKTVMGTGPKKRSGSAVAISSNPQMLLTNCHVVMWKDSAGYYTNYGSPIRVFSQLENPNDAILASAASANCNIDIVFLVVQKNNTSRLAHALNTWRTFESLKVGEPVFSYGNPLGLPFTFASGTISAKRANVKEFGGMRDVNLVQTTAPISPGSSGGALIDQWGNLVAITQSHMTEGQNLNFAVAVDQLWK